MQSTISNKIWLRTNFGSVSQWSNEPLFVQSFRIRIAFSTGRIFASSAGICPWKSCNSYQCWSCMKLSAFLHPRKLACQHHCLLRSSSYFIVYDGFPCGVWAHTPTCARNLISLWGWKWPQLVHTMQVEDQSSRHKSRGLLTYFPYPDFRASSNNVNNEPILYGLFRGWDNGKEAGKLQKHNPPGIPWICCATWPAQWPHSSERWNWPLLLNRNQVNGTIDYQIWASSCIYVRLDVAKCTKFDQTYTNPITSASTQVQHIMHLIF